MGRKSNSKKNRQERSIAVLTPEKVAEINALPKSERVSQIIFLLIDSGTNMLNARIVQEQVDLLPENPSIDDYINCLNDITSETVSHYS
jgi:hypothetical protein